MDDPNDTGAAAATDPNDLVEGGESSSSDATDPNDLVEGGESSSSDASSSSDIPTTLELTARAQNAEARITRLEALLACSLEILDNEVRHHGQVHNNQHLELLELVLEEPESKAHRAEGFAAARAEITRRTREANRPK